MDHWARRALAPAAVARRFARVASGRAPRRVPIDGGMPARLTFDCDRVGAYRISPDGQRIAYGADEGGNERWQVWVMNADGTGARRLTADDDRIHHLRAWTQDGRSLVVHANLRD